MDFTNSVEALSALAQDTRLAVFRLLVREGGQQGHGEKPRAAHAGAGAGAESRVGLSAGVIAAQLKVPPATLSFHLAKLEHAGLIKAKRESLNIFYSADHEGIRSLLAYLTEDCCQGRPELCGGRLPETFDLSSPQKSTLITR
ncbi:MAG: metalloregulator ArsR/SmtB family transcription factor [Alphaproteobacteria bacterium]